MKDMEENEYFNVETEGDAVLATWKAFNNIIIDMFKNTDELSTSLPNLITSIMYSIDSSPNIFTTDNNTHLTQDERLQIHQKYDTFTTWMLGRLFYILGLKNMQSVYDASIETQLAILKKLHEKQISSLFSICDNYFKMFYQLVNHLANNVNGFKQLILEIFVIEDESAIPTLQLTSSQIYIEDEEICQDIIVYTLKIISEVLPLQLNTLWTNDITVGIFDYTNKIIKTSSLKIKMAVVIMYSKIINECNLKFFKKFPYIKNFAVTLTALDDVMFLIPSWFNNGIINKEDLTIFNNTVIIFLTALLKQPFNGDSNDIFLLKICLNVITCDSTIISSAAKNIACDLAQNLLLCQPVSQSCDLRSYHLEFTHCSKAICLTQTCVLKELLDSNLTNISVAFLGQSENQNLVFKYSPTWKLLKEEFNRIIDTTDVNNIEQNLRTINLILKCALWVDVEFSIHHQNIHSQEKQCFCNKTYSNESFITEFKEIKLTFFDIEYKKCLKYLKKEVKGKMTLNLFDVVMDTSMCLSQILGQCDEIIFSIFTSPFLKQIPGLKFDVNFIHEDFGFYEMLLEIQLKAITCIVNCKMTNNLNMLSKIINFCMSSEEESLTEKIIELMPNIYYNFKDYINPETILEYLFNGLQKNKKSVTIAVVKTFPMFICSLDKYSMITTDNISNMETRTYVCCFKCDPKNIGFSRNNLDLTRIKGKIMHLGNNNQFSKIFDSILKFRVLFTSDDTEIKKYAVSLFSVFFHHCQSYNEKDMIENWINYCIDADQDVRNKFVAEFKTVVQKLYNEPTISSEDLEEIQQIIIMKLLLCVKKSLELSDLSLQETTLSLLYLLGTIKCRKLILYILKMLIHFLMNPDTPYVSLARMYVRDICRNHDMTENEVYHTYKKDFCKQMTDLAVIYFGADVEFAQSITEVTRAFDFKGPRNYIFKESNHFLPYLIPLFVKIPRTVPILKSIADLLQKSPAQLLIDHFMTIFPHVYLTETPQVAEQCMQFISGVTKISQETLQKNNFRPIIAEITIYYHCKTATVISLCTMLSKIDPDFAITTSKQMSLSQVADFLNLRFLGILAHFDCKLVNKQQADSLKRRAIESLSDIIRLMGSKYITPLKYKVLATLRSALTINMKQFGQQVVNIWIAFIHTIDVQSLAPLLSTIFVSLLPLLKKFPKDINGIFRYLVVNNENLLSLSIPDLFFISETNIDSDVIKTVSKHMNRIKHDTLIENLKLILKQVNHENVEIRLYGLQNATKLLSENKQQLNDAILSGDAMHPVIVELIDALVTGCRESHDSLKLAYGKCLGELGAIEPSHLPRQSQQEQGTFTLSAKDDDFSRTALFELLRALQFEKHTKFMDSFALAIQEILKFYSISPTRKEDIWNSFPENMQQIMVPLLSSRYISHSSDKNEINSLPHPLFGSSIASTFSEWAYLWTCTLIPKVGEEKIRDLFSSCKHSIKRDLRTLITFLPYILLHALIECEQSLEDKIYEEMHAVISLNSFKTVKPQTRKSNYKVLHRYFYDAVPQEEAVIESDTQLKCSKMIYVLLDFLERWILEWQNVKLGGGSGNILQTSKPEYKSLHKFIQRFDKLELSQGNFLCDEYARALMYLESYVGCDDSRIYESLSQFSMIYAKLEEGDAVAGLMSLNKKEPSLDEKILFHEVTGQLQDAAACYERKAQNESLSVENVKCLMQCYLGLNQPFTAYSLSSGYINESNQDDLITELCGSQAEALWRLGMWDDLEILLNHEKVTSTNSWGVRMGKSMLLLRDEERDKFGVELDTARKSLMNCLGTASIEKSAYQQGYSSIVKLHILNEFEKAEQLVYNVQNTQNIEQLTKLIDSLLTEWQLRLNIVQSSETIMEPVLSFRRIVLEQVKCLLYTHPSNITDILDEHIGKLWLKSIQVARKAGLYQQTYTYILNAETYKLKELFLEKAKLHWQKGEQSAALRTLKRGIDEYFPDANMFKKFTSGRETDRKLCAEAKLLIAKYNDDSVHVDMEENILNYKEAIEVFKEWEESFVCLAQYYDKVYSSYSEKDKQSKDNLLILIINYYGKSLLYGCNYIHQSMPRMLSIWLDYGTTNTVSKSNDDKERKNNIVNMTTLINNFTEKLPCFMFFTAFSQLVSRICHPQKEVFTQLKTILIKLISKYPQQSMWMILCVFKSGYTARHKRCQDVLQDPRLKDKNMVKLISDFNRLAEQIIDLTNKPILDAHQNVQVSSIARGLPRLLTDSTFSEIMMPVQEFRKLVLPSEEYYNNMKDQDTNRNQFNAFPNKMVYIKDVYEDVLVLPSLQKPRRITFKGSDGNKYMVMLKPKDDLRKDFRLMEFNAIVNQYLHKDPDARQRRLKIRTYSVIPLNEECGIIEWVSNLVGLRPILLNIYKQKGIYTVAKVLKTMICSANDPIEKKLKVFQEGLLPRHPPIFPEWFRFKFPDPHEWYQAKCAYTRTTAVISMVGYILGLGDRHGENILFDSTNGDTIHVDFNCLFNRGEVFEYPERVPFRLTHNMVRAMGPLGVEGIFRHSCEVTLRVLRSQTDTLMSVVRPFVYDPLMSGSKPQSKLDLAERTDKESIQHVQHIEQRLKGVVRSKGKQLTTTLSPEGQANNLILEATSVQNLCQMYIGWGPYL